MWRTIVIVLMGLALLGCSSRKSSQEQSQQQINELRRRAQETRIQREVASSINRQMGYQRAATRYAQRAERDRQRALEHLPQALGRESRYRSYSSQSLNRQVQREYQRQQAYRQIQPEQQYRRTREMEQTYRGR